VCASWSAGATRRGGFSVQRPLLVPLYLSLLCWGLPQGIGITCANPVAAPTPLTSAFTLMREALHQALHLRFIPAFEMTMHLEQQTQYALEAQLVRGIIAYFQGRWQISPPPARQSGQKALSTLLKEGQRQLARYPREPRLQLVLGIAVIFHELLQQKS